MLCTLTDKRTKQMISLSLIIVIVELNTKRAITSRVHNTASSTSISETFLQKHVQVRNHRRRQIVQRHRPSQRTLLKGRPLRVRIIQLASEQSERFIWRGKRKVEVVLLQGGEDLVPTPLVRLRLRTSRRGGRSGG